MLLLFVDTETSDLTPTKGQVIEIAGVLVELDEKTLDIKVINQFDSLVRIRNKLLCKSWKLLILW